MHRTAARTRRPARKQATRGTVLVIEDERFVRGVTCEILRDAGYRVLDAECAAAARSIFQRSGKQIQLLLCDVVLPDSSGAALVQALRQQSPGLKIILASGYPPTGLPATDAESASEFLAKPYGAAALIAKVQMALHEGSEPSQARWR